MHDTAAAFGAAFFRSYVDVIEQPRILEIGAGDVNGSLRGCAPSTAQYTGADLQGGPGVDLVLADPYLYPFEAESFDAIISSSCLEHDPMFWLTFAEMCRVVGSGGFIYLNAPSNGWFHRYPTDNWRFYPDAGIALAEWGRRSGYDIHLIESFIGRRRRDIWNDCVMVFGKAETQRPGRLLSDLFPRSFNVRVGEEQGFRNYCDRTEDMRLQAWLTEKLNITPDAGTEPGDTWIGGMIATLAEREIELAAAQRNAAEREAAAEARHQDEMGAAAEAEIRLAEAVQGQTDAEQRAAHAENRLAGAVRRYTDAERHAAQAERRLAEAVRQHADTKQRAAQAEKRLAEAVGQHADAEQRAAQAEGRVAAVEERAATQEAKIADITAHAAQVEAERDRLRHERDAVLDSTAWLATWPLRSAASRLPLHARRPLRGVAKLAWWTMTLQLSRKLTDRRRIRTWTRTVTTSACFDDAWYRQRYPDVAAAGADSALHYVLFGASERRNPGPGFDSAWYLERYPDVAAAGHNPLVHYLEYGAAEGRERRAVGAATIEASDFFDSAWYLARYPDAAKSDLDPASNYVLFGAAERRDPGPGFDSAWYLERYPDVAATGLNPLVHYLEYGAAEGRERRAVGAATIEASDFFDSAWYLARYPDAAKSDLDPASNYVLFGASERRNPGPGFDSAWYLERYPDVAAAGHNPLVHYLEYGAAEGRERRTIGAAATGPRSPTAQFLDVPIHRQRLVEYVAAQAGTDAASRVCGYFDIIESLAPGASACPSWRQEMLQLLVTTMRGRAQRLNESRRIEASVIVPAFNHIEHTIACVVSLLEHRCRTRFEVIIGNNVSTDETETVFNAVGGIVRCISHQSNDGFLRNCNLCANETLGEYLVLLNNDTVIVDGWLDELLAPFQRFEKVGLVGSKLLNPDGTLQEAGGIIWRDASGWNFGRGQDPALPQYNYVKDVDYVSGATIAIPKALWEEIGGFDERYLPAYFEDADLAFSIRARGYRTLYAPASELIHHEGVTHGTDVTAGTVKSYQIRNSRIFAKKWEPVLSADQFASGEYVFLARDRSRKRPHVLVVDHYIPQPDRDAGSRTIFDYCRLLVDAGLQVSFWPDNLQFDRPYAKELQDLGIEVLFGDEWIGQFARWIEETGEHIDYFLLSRAQIADSYINLIRANSFGRVIFYAHDLNSARLQMQYELTSDERLLPEVECWKALELRIWQAADVIYYPSEEETNIVAGCVPDRIVRTLPAFTYPRRELQAERRRIETAKSDSAMNPSLLFVGGFRHAPNPDAAIWLVSEILPRVSERMPGTHTFIVGSFPPPEVTRLASSEITVTGYVSDALLHQLYRSSSLVVAPLRFGGGVKGKVLDGLRFGTPVVTTSVGTQGMGAAENYLEIADDPEEFAEGIIKLLADPRLRRDRALRGLDYVEAAYSYAAVARVFAQDIPEIAGLLDGRHRLRDFEGE